MKAFSPSWKSSAKPKKQRKYRAHAPSHVKKKLLRVHLSRELRQKHKRRNLIARAGDKVKVIKGDFRGHEGKIERVDTKNTLIFIGGVEKAKKDGTKALIGIAPASVMATELALEDKRRLGTEAKAK